MLSTGQGFLQSRLYRTSSAVYNLQARHISTASRQQSPIRRRSIAKTMGKNKKSSAPDEQHLHLGRPSSHISASIADTHTHLHSTFSAYRSKYPAGRYETVFDFVRGIYAGRDVDALVDVWCEAPVMKTQWKDLADSAVAEESRRTKWAGIEYWFVMGASASLVSFYHCIGTGGKTTRCGELTQCTRGSSVRDRLQPRTEYNNGDSDTKPSTILTR